jgi:hypothetical protein
MFTPSAVSALVLAAAFTAPGQSAAPAVESARPRADAGSVLMHPGAATLSRMMRVVSADFADNTVEQCFKFVKDVSGVDLEILWSEGGNPGLDKERTITLSAKNMTLLSLVEAILDKATSDLGPSQATWQMTDSGSMQVGLKTSLNTYRRLVIYDITDMLFEIRDKTNVPELDLQAAFQNTGGGGGGGGGGGSPFGGGGGQQQPQQADPNRRQNIMNEVKNLITTLVEPQQWADGGGDGGSVTIWQSSLLINAPDYMHRQIDGYPYWPNSTVVPASAAGGRYVTFDADVQRSSYDQIRQVPVPAGTGR